MMTTRTVCLMLLALGLFTLGCDDGSSGDAGPTGPVRDATVADVALDDVGPEDDGAPPGDAALDAALDAASDATLDAGSDASRPPRPGSCEAICARYDACGEVDAVGSVEACEARCARILEADASRVEGWWTCLEGQECAWILACGTPEPPPLSCEETCDFAAACGASDSVTDCKAACDVAVEAFTRCGDLVAVTCDLPAYERCVLNVTEPECVAVCDGLVACGRAQPDHCVQGCTAERAASEGEVLSDFRSTRRRACVTNARGRCDEIDRCYTTPTFEAPGVEAFCAAFDACAFDVGDYSCHDYYLTFREGSGVAGLACITTDLEAACPDDPFDASAACARRTEEGPVCAELCDIQIACGVNLDVDFITCFSACTERLTTDSDEVRRSQARVACVSAETCEGLTTCLEAATPAADCEAHCARLDACGLAAEDCAVTCDGAWPRDRAAAYRLAVAAADDCEAVAAVTQTEPFGCTGACERREGCDADDAPETCLARCDDASFAAPARYGERVFCELSAADCTAVRDCDRHPEAARTDRHFCRATSTTCVPDAPNDLEACAVTASAPLNRAEAQRRADAEACLGGLGLEESCEDTLACVPPLVDLDCATLCPQLDACGLSPEGCAEICPVDPITDDHGFEITICQAGQADCEILTACVEVEMAVADDDSARCTALCDARAACEPGLAAPGCAADCRAALRDPNRELRVRPSLVCAAPWSCGELATCLAEHSTAQTCAAHCDILAGCGLDPAPDCAQICLDAFEAARQLAARACTAEMNDCETLAACVPAEGPPCALACDRITSCGRVSATCEIDCDDRAYADPTEGLSWIACVLSAPECRAADDAHGVLDCDANPDAGGEACFGYCRARTTCDPSNETTMVDCLMDCVDGFDDAEGLRFAGASPCLAGVQPDAMCAPLVACTPLVEAFDCAEHCARLDACGQASAECVAECEATPDADVAGCVVEMVRVNRGCEGISACLGLEPIAASDTCQTLCQRREACDPALDAYLCSSECTPDPAGLQAQLVCADLSSCDALDVCLALDGAVPEGCQSGCDALAVCGGTIDAAACAQICAGRAASPAANDDYPAAVTACAEALGEVCEIAEGDTCLDPAACEDAAIERSFVQTGGRVRVDTRGAPNRYGASCGASAAGPERVFELRLTAASSVHLELENADYDTVLFVRSACDESNSEVDCDDDGGVGSASAMDLNLDPGVYFVFVDGYSGASGVSDLVIELNAR